MQRIGVIGLNHKLADIRLREVLAAACDRLFAVGHPFHGSESFFVLLSTCNRTEIYFWSDDLAAAHRHLLALLRREVAEEFDQKLYSYFGPDCFLHLARVTAGLDSAVIGESEIQRQVKLAYERSRTGQDLPFELHLLFQKSLGIGKKIRSHWKLGKNLADLETTLVQCATRWLGGLEDPILIVGASSLNRTIAQQFKLAGASRLFICNRTPERAAAFSAELGTEILPWKDLSHWPKFQAVIVGTKSLKPVLTTTDSDPHHRPILIDLSVPRNIDPELGKSRPLINIDQIDAMVARERHIHQELVLQAGQDVAEYVSRQLEIYQRKRATLVAEIA